jgi:hypothetical protein
VISSTALKLCNKRFADSGQEHGNPRQGKSRRQSASPSLLVIDTSTVLLPMGMKKKWDLV